MIKRFMIITAFVAFFACNAFAATSGNIMIWGSIPNLVSITTFTAPGAGSIGSPMDLTVSQSALNIGTVTESSNDSAGYTVTATSLNNGSMKTGAGSSFPYQVTYGGSPTVSLSSPQNVTVVNSQAVPMTVQNNITIAFTGASPATALSGTFSDTMTFTIAAH